MDATFKPAPGCSLRIYSASFEDEDEWIDTWYAEFHASVAAKCVFGERHIYKLHDQIEITSQTPEPILTHFEWAVRGNNLAAAQLCRILVDRELAEVYYDPCVAPE